MSVGKPTKNESHTDRTMGLNNVGFFFFKRNSVNCTRKKNKNAWLGPTETNLTSENMTRVRIMGHEDPQQDKCPWK